MFVVFHWTFKISDKIYICVIILDLHKFTRLKKCTNITSTHSSKPVFRLPSRVIIVLTNERPSLEMREAADRGKLLSVSFPQAACLWEPRTGAGAGKVDISDDE